MSQAPAPSDSVGLVPSHATVSLNHDSPELAATYEEASTYQFNHGKILIGALDIAAGERVLDIGSGTGRLGAFVADLVGPSGQVVGVDPLPLRVEIAQQKGKGNFEARVGRAEDLTQFGDASFDVVYLNSVFHWVGDKPRALAEIFRVLKPGGRLGLNSANPRRIHESRQLIREVLQSQGIGEEPGAAQGVDLDELQALTAEAGFIDFDGREHTLVDYHPDADSLIAWSNSSSFGNFLLSISAADQTRLRDSLANILESKRTADGIRLERYLVFATTRKPRQQ